MVVRRTRRSWKVIGITEWSKEGGREEMGWDGMGCDGKRRELWKSRVKWINKKKLIKESNGKVWDSYILINVTLLTMTCILFVFFIFFFFLQESEILCLLKNAENFGWDVLDAKLVLVYLFFCLFVCLIFFSVFFFRYSSFLFNLIFMIRV